MRILQVNQDERVGGAAQIAWSLHGRFRARGHDAWMAVGFRQGDGPAVVRIPKVPADDGAGPLRRALLARARALDAPVRAGDVARGLAKVCLRLAAPPRLADAVRGLDVFHHPGSWGVAGLTPAPPEVVHLHNLHSHYFDVRAVAPLSARFPVVVTMHDAWLLSGHCAHSFGCERWREGCGACPDLAVDPPMRRDHTAYAWAVKRDTFANSRVHLVTPCRWLLEKAQGSLLAPALAGATVIPNGTDLTLFRPGDRAAARARLGLPPDAAIVLFAASGIRKNPFKDYRTLRAALPRAAARLGGELLCVALGEDAPEERMGGATIRFVPYASDRGEVAAYYVAADVYAHAARAETFPNTVVEALACGTPVVASAVGGIPEQVRDLAAGAERATGSLVPPEDPEALAVALADLVADAPRRRRLGENAARDARERFDLERQVDAHLALYDEVTTRGSKR
jgi:glycosyltransferase involved in cell wall biosynthesis